MDFSLDDEQSLLVSTVRRWSSSELGAWAAEADREGQVPDKLWARAGDLGLLLDAIPESHGGLSESHYSHLGRVLRSIELGHACGSLGALVESNTEPALAVSAHGSDGAREALFAALTDEKHPRIAVTINDFYERLELSEVGDGLGISGRIGPTPGLALASHALVLVRQAEGTCVCLLDIDSSAVQPCTPSGWRAAGWGSIELKDHAIAGDRILDRGKDGHSLAHSIMSWFRLGLGGRAIGTAAAAIEHAENYCRERVQFGRAIGSFQSLALLRDENQTAIAAARLLLLDAAWAMDQGLADGPERASRARDLACRTLSKAAIDAVQMFGGYGFVNDFPVEKIMRDARVFEVIGGNESFSRVLEMTPAE